MGWKKINKKIVYSSTRYGTFVRQINYEERGVRTYLVVYMYLVYYQ